MNRIDTSAADADIHALYTEEVAAMVAGDVIALGSLLSDDFTLTLMTGYRQPKTEWLHDVETEQMKYHDIITKNWTIEYEEKAPVLTARTHTRATIWGSTGTWRLQLRTWFEPETGGWLISRTVASTW